MVENKSGTNRKLYETQEATTFYTQEGFLDREADILSGVLTNKNASILDLGCGTGRSTKAIFGMGYKNILGVDYAASMIERAQKRYPNIQFQQGDACTLNFTDNSFDIALFLYQGIDCIESDEKRANAYKEIFRVTKSGGSFVHSAHNILWLNSKFKTTWAPLLRDIFTGRAFTGSYRTLPHGYGDETIIFRKRGFVIHELKRAGFINIELIQSRNGVVPIFQPYWHFIAQKP